MNDAKDRPRERFPPPATPYLPVQTGRGHVKTFVVRSESLVERTKICPRIPVAVITSYQAC